MSLDRILEWELWGSKAFVGPPGPHPPYMIHEIKGLFFVKNSIGQKKNSTGYKTKEEALKLQKHLYDALPPELKSKFKNVGLGGM